VLRCVDRVFTIRTQSDRGSRPSSSSLWTTGRANSPKAFTSVDKKTSGVLIDREYCNCSYHRDDYSTENGNLLGEAQWEWLENELMTSTAAFNVLVSGVQILPGDRYPVAECWGRFPSQRERLLKLILASNAKGVILLRFAVIDCVLLSFLQPALTRSSPLAVAMCISRRLTRSFAPTERTRSLKLRAPA
jgi:hypothetical protein